MNANIMMDLDGGRWATLNPSRCECRGSGWMSSDFDTYHKCPIHYRGQPHPEMDCEEDLDTFDWEAASLENQREAYWTFCRDSGLWMPDFNDMVRKAVGPEASIQEWVDAAESVAQDIVREALEQKARDAGYSCRLEAAWDAEAAVEAGARHRGLDPEVYAPAGSPERADADSWYPRF